MKYNKEIWNLIDKHNKHFGNTWAILVHNKFEDTMFVYDVLAGKKRTMEYMLKQVFASGRLGEYMTVRELTELYITLNEKLQFALGMAI